MKNQLDHTIPYILFVIMMVLIESCSTPPSETTTEPTSLDSSLIDIQEPVKAGIQKHDLDTVFELDLSGQGLTEVPDLSMYPHLKRLDLSHNQIELREYDDFTKLVHDNIANHHWSSMDLEYLDLSHNRISTLNYPFKISEFPSLQYLDLSHNQIKRFWPIGYSLTKLDLSHNELDSLFILDFRLDTLDLSYNKRLRGRQVVETSLIRHIQLDGVNESRLKFQNCITITDKIICTDDFEEPSQAEVDSLIFERELRRNLNETLRINDPFTKYPISLLQEMVFYENGTHYSIGPGKITESPDKKFKIYQLEGSRGGAYTNTFWKSFIHTTRNYNVRELELTEIDTIYVLPDNKYLIVHHHWSHVIQAYGEARKYADLIVITKRGVQVHPIHTPSYPWHSEEKEIERLKLVSGCFTKELLNLSYNSMDSLLSYEFSNNLNCCCSVDSTYMYSGAYKYINGEFVHQYEDRSGIKEER